MTGAVMYPTDRYYGHGDILRRWTGLDEERPIWAHLQHGWNPHAGFGTKYLGQGFEHGEERLHPFFPALVWSERNRHAAASAGVSHVTAIGSPFLYLDAMAAGPGDADRCQRRGTIVYPIHSGSRPATVQREDARLSHLIRGVEDDRPVTVCLYWRDYDIESVRTTYERAGFRVITHGRREDPRFLELQRSELARHERVVSNRISTAVFYGAWLGAEVEVYGPVFGSGNEAYTRWFDELQRREFPELIEQPLGGDDARRLAGRELGEENLRSPAELADLLGWTGLRRWAGPVVAEFLERRRARGGTTT